jgi:hypothetical protein
MSTEVKKEEVKFDALKTIATISADEDLKAVFTNKTSLDVNTVITMIESNTVTKKVNEVLNGIFTNLILSRDNYVAFYNRAEGKTAEDIKKGGKPRRLGKRAVEKMIAERGEKTEPLRMMLSVNDLKNTYLKLERKGINEVFDELGKLSDKDCRTVIASIEALRKKLKNIL